MDYYKRKNLSYSYAIIKIIHNGSNRMVLRGANPHTILKRTFFIIYKNKKVLCPYYIMCWNTKHLMHLIMYGNIDKKFLLQQ